MKIEMFLLPLQPLFRVNVFIVLTRSTLQTIAARGVLKKEMFLKILQNSQGNSRARGSFFVKLQASFLQPH